MGGGGAEEEEEEEEEGLGGREVGEALGEELILVDENTSLLSPSPSPSPAGSSYSSLLLGLLRSTAIVKNTRREREWVRGECHTSFWPAGSPLSVLGSSSPLLITPLPPFSSLAPLSPTTAAGAS